MKNKKNLLIAAFIILFVFSACTNPTGDDKNNNSNNNSNDKTGDSTFLGSLKSLGVRTNLGRQKDPNGNDLYNGYNPLGVKGVSRNSQLDDASGAAARRARAVEDGAGSGGGRGVLYKQAEIYLVNETEVALYEDLVAGYSLTQLDSEPGASAWAGSAGATNIFKRAFANDFDGDGKDEVLIVALNATTKKVSVRYMDYKNGITSREVNTWNYTGNIPVNAWDMGISSGDLDGDGKDELIITIFSEVYILDDVDNNFIMIDHWSVGSNNFTFAACADYDQDGYDEFIITTGNYGGANDGTYTIYEDLAHGGRTRVIKSGHLHTGDHGIYHYATVATGDFNGDGLPDTAFCGSYGDHSTASTIQYGVFCLMTTMDNNSNPVFTMTNGIEASGGIWGVVAGDMDMDGRDEIVARNGIYRVARDVAEHRGLSRIGTWTGYGTAFDMADVTGDKKADFVIHSSSDELKIVSLNSSGGITTQTIDKDGGTLRSALCLPNVDDDSYVLEFAGHELRFTKPVVQAVIASPPYYAASDNDSGGTTLGWGQSEGKSTGTTHGFSVGVSVGVKVTYNAPVTAIKIGEWSLKATVENSFTWGSAWSREVTETWQYNTGTGEDKVIFTAVPFDVYYYTVISAPEGVELDGEKVLAPGDTMFVSVPRKPGTYNASLVHYNAVVDGYRIPSSVLHHTLGNPWTYYRLSDVNRLKEASKDEKGKVRGLFTKFAQELRTGYSNTGSTSRSFEEATTEETSYNYDLGVTVEGEVQAGIVTVGASAAYNYGYSSTSSTGESTFIEGEVPDISISAATNAAFNWGLLMYPVKDGDQAYNFVTYWVDD